MVIHSNKRWKQAFTADSKKIKEISDELNFSPLFVEVCFQRGLKTANQIKEFLKIDETDFHDPFLLNDMNKGIERIVEAIENNEKICIYGDYDADGISSTALVYETLDSIGANIDYYLPNRFVEGYGPDISAFSKIIEKGTSLIITVDNGVSGHEAIEFAQNQGVDVIVTDHHALPIKLPDAYAIIHPAHPEASYPFKDLAGVGVALKLATALLGELPVELLDLAAIGTVADLVPLIDENRAIVYFGLKMMQNTQRIGLTELFQIIGIEAQELKEDSIGFQIGPRLNAIGRLGDANPGVELLTTHNPARAKELAEFTDTKNIKRKSIVEEMAKQAFEKLADKDSSEVIVLADEEWHEGVLGIVASRIVEKTQKPTLLFAIDPEKAIAKGSARSVQGVNLFESLTEVKDLLISFGGHEMAAGMSAKTENLLSIEKKLSAYVKEVKKENNIKIVDAFIDLKELSVEKIKELEKLRPFGTANSKPLIATKDVSVIQNRTVGLDGDHLKLKVAQEKDTLDIISFRNGQLNEYLFNEQMIDVLGYIELNEWNGQTKVQMQMTDLHIPTIKMVDQRVNQLKLIDFQEKNASYIFYNQRNYQLAKEILDRSSDAIMINTVKEAEEFKSQNKLIVVDCPSSIEIFKETVTENEQTIYCHFYKKDHLYLTGLPTRLEFKKLYQFIRKNGEIDLQKNGHHMVNYLEIESNKIFLMVQVFLEAKFVIMNNGLLNFNDNPEKVDLEQTVYYQNAVKQFKAEELFLYSSFKEIVESLEL